MATILVVDDHVVNRAFLVTLLSYAKHRLLEAADGAEGLRVMQAEQPDLVVSDILMPHMDGHEFVTRMHETPRLADIPVIFYTAGYHEAEARVIARSCGVTRVLAKPAEPELILQAVNEALGLDAGLVTLPHLTAPPAEGSRFSTIDNQLAEYLVELESSSILIAQLVAQPELGEANVIERATARKRLCASLASLQAASGRLSALVEISREIAAESETATGTDPELAIPAIPAPARAASAVVSANEVALPPVSRERARFQARLGKALQFSGYPHDSPTQLAREFNFRFPGKPVTIHAARKWLVGESIPTQDKLRILAQWLGVTAEWLRFGDTEHAGPADSRTATRAPGITSEEGKLLAELMALDPYHRRLAHDFVSMLASKAIQDGATRKSSGALRPKPAREQLP